MAERVGVVIVGAGPAGIAAATYLQRAGLAPLVLESGEPGGLLRNANLVENYPGFPGGVRGEELAAQFAQHLSHLHVRVNKERVKLVTSRKGLFLTRTDANEYISKTAIIATGTLPKKVTIPGAAGLIGKKVFSDIASIIPAEIQGKKILVLGGGDAAFDYALNLRGRGGDVTILSRSEPRCLPLLRDRAERETIGIQTGFSPEKMEDMTGGVTVRCRRGSKRANFSGNLVLVALGRVPNTDMLDEQLLRRIRDPKRLPETSVPGLFLAGDVIRGQNRQAGIAVGDGVLAAMLVEQHLRRGSE